MDVDDRFVVSKLNPRKLGKNRVGVDPHVYDYLDEKSGSRNEEFFESIR